MRSILEAISPEDRIYISKLSEDFYPFSRPHLDVKWGTDDGTTKLYIIDRTGGPGWQGNSLAICIGGDKYRISVSWGDLGPYTKYHARASIFYREMLLEVLSADIRELADAAIFASCEYENSMWGTDIPFSGVEITY